MAAVSIPPSPQTFSMMSSRRIPLAHVPNAANSPFRAVAAAASKRSRSHSSVQRELPYGQAPPAKKQMIERDESSLRTPPRRPLLPDPERKIFARKSTAGLPTEFARRLVEAKEAREQQQYDARHDKVVIENLEHIRQWRKHYRKVFPQYVFYFESISDDMRYKLSKQLASLGAVSHQLCRRNLKILLNINSRNRGKRNSFRKPSRTLSLPGRCLQTMSLQNPQLQCLLLRRLWVHSPPISLATSTRPCWRRRLTTSKPKG